MKFSPWRALITAIVLMATPATAMAGTGKSEKEHDLFANSRVNVVVSARQRLYAADQDMEQPFALASVRPAQGGISSGFGPRKLSGSRSTRHHNGIDIKAAHGSPVLATSAGTVTFTGWRGAYGKLVEIAHPNGVVTRYAHLSAINVKKGQSVGQGQRIGKVGKTGRVTGAHLHFEILVDKKPVDPLRHANWAKREKAIATKG